MNASEGILTRWALVNRGIDAKNAEWIAEQFTEASLQMEALRKRIVSEKGRADKSEAACAEMRGACELTIEMYEKIGLGSRQPMSFALKDPKNELRVFQLIVSLNNLKRKLEKATCGTGWLSPEVRKMAIGALQWISDNAGGNGGRIVAEKALAALKDDK